MPDPAREPGSIDDTLPAFELTINELSARISFLIAAIAQPTIGKAGGDDRG